MWLKLTEIKMSGHTKTILLNSDAISHMMQAERNNADTYIRMKQSDCPETFYFVKETIDTIYGMLNPVSIVYQPSPYNEIAFPNFSEVSNNK
jgi:hypothetical protein